MFYVKATVVGVVTGLVAGLLWVVGNLFVPMYAAMLIGRLRGDGAGIGAGYVGSGSTMLVVLIGFAAGFWWTRRRFRRRPL